MTNHDGRSSFVLSPSPSAEAAAALDWLFEFSDWERGVGWNAAAAPDEHWKLGRTRALLDLAGAPDRSLRCVLVAGTKGKGSTATMLEAVTRAAGWRTGLYTQPHIHSYLERVRLSGAPIEACRFSLLVDRLRQLVDRLRATSPQAGEPTTFELTTVLAILAFAGASVDLAVLEVGMGGRLDATNAVEPMLSVITPIGLDHTQVLGSSIDSIAREKVGIVRPGGTVVAAQQRRAARRVIVDTCEALGARLRFAGPLPSASRPNMVVARLGRSAPFAARLPVAGAHQRQNAGVAVAAAAVLGGRGLPIAPAAVRLGLERVELPGRFELVGSRPTVVLDAAHNGDSASALARTLRDMDLPRPRWLVLGVLRDKDAASIFRPLVRQIDGALVTTAASPRALPGVDLAAVCRQAGAREVKSIDTVARALDEARRLAGREGTVVAAGSFAVVAEARAALRLVPVDDSPAVRPGARR